MEVDLFFPVRKSLDFYLVVTLHMVLRGCLLLEELACQIIF